MTGRCSSRAPRRRYRRAGLAGSTVAGLIFFWLVTVGSWNPIHLEPSVASGFYDAQAHSWLEGHWDVALKDVGVEAIEVGGRHQMYFGPVPALLRVPALAFTERLDHRLSALSIMGAYTVTMVASTALGWRIRVARRGTDAMLSRSESAATFGYFLLLGGGSIVTFMASRAWVYNEAILWGVAFSLAAFVAIFDHVAHPSAKTLALTSLFATGAMGSRVTVGLAAVGALAAVEAGAVAGAADRWFGRRRPESSWRPIPDRLARWFGTADVPPFTTAIALAVPIVASGLVNWIRFGTVAGIPFHRQTFVNQLQPERLQVLTDVGTSGVSIAHLPTNLIEYLRPDGFALDRLFPFITFPQRTPVLIGDVAFAGLEPTASITSTMPLFVALGAVGLVAVLRSDSQRTRRLVTLRPLVVGATLAAFATLCFVANSHRYEGDFVPLLVVASLVGFHEMHVRITSPSRRQHGLAWHARSWAGPILLGALVVALMYVNVSLSLAHQRILTRDAGQRAEFVAFQQAVDERLFPNREPAAEWGSELPSDPPAGHLFVIGSCRGLYQSTMETQSQHPWERWQAVERTAATGGFRLRAVFPEHPSSHSEPVLVSGPLGDRSVLAVEWLGNDSARFSLLLEGTGESFRGDPFELHNGEERLLEVVFDPRTSEVLVNIDDENVLASFFWRPYPDAPITVGDGAKGISGAAPRFTGELVDEPLPTPVCDRMAARRRDP